MATADCNGNGAGPWPLTMYCGAGVESIMIHSWADTPDEVASFVRRFRAEVSADKPAVVVPFTYSQATDTELASAGVNVVIYANHLLRAAYPAMKACVERILECERAKDFNDQLCMPINEILTLI